MGKVQAERRARARPEVGSAWQVQKRKKAGVARVIEDQERGNPDHGEEFGFILHAATRVFMFEKTTQVAVRRYISGSQESAVPG